MSERDTKPVHIRDVPADVVDTLQAGANAEGMSLSRSSEAWTSVASRRANRRPR
ncbi:hypothetical protein ACRAKI_24965 [Saccharothrix isguenensis]